MSRGATEPVWAHWHDKKLLRLRMCDLGVTIGTSAVAPRIRQLHEELKARGLRFRPYFWLSDDWYTPDGVPGIAVPFYMAHPRLARLEASQMLEVEGGTDEWCMRILRHEAGHAIENAYRLRRRRRRIALFGRSSQTYPASYTPRPYSKSFVQHLEAWYAQSHPDEDFAETFAVWLTPDAQWESRYADWPALKKLRYVDETMRALAGVRPLVRTRRTVDPLEKLTKTLKEHYAERHRHHDVEVPHTYDRELRRLFSSAPEFRRNPPATTFLRRVRRDMRRLVATSTGAYQYTVDQVLADILDRCRELELRLTVSETQARLDFAVLLTVQTMNVLHTGGHRVTL
ncbi:MAG TPA: putative zinc-binding metallopeptidase [Candidatus Eisenbacteria bacterium]|nr:putative zinc-binding metallopeptidase [Candidatus Eisenbacteria bacterium]